MNGWINDIADGVVWGSLIHDGEEFEFSIPILGVLECQRVELEPGRYVSFVNGYMLIDKTIWTTHDVENADRKAREMHETLGWA